MQRIPSFCISTLLWEPCAIDRSSYLSVRYFHFQCNAVSQYGRVYQVIPCTKRAVLDASLPTLSNPSLIVSSVLSNFLCDACSAVDLSQLVEAANSEISLHVRTLHGFLLANPQTRCVIVPPLARQTPVWFNSYLPCFVTYLISEVTKLGPGRIQVLAPFVALSLSFEADGVHLNS